MPNPPQHCSFQGVLTMWCSACHTRLRRDRTCNTTGCENFRPSCRGSWLSSRNKTRSRTRQRDPQPPTPTPTPEDASVPQDHMTPPRTVLGKHVAVSAAIRSRLSDLAVAIGEPEAWQVIGSCLHVIRCIPSRARLEPQPVWVAALFHMGWALAGSREQEQPREFMQAGDRQAVRDATVKLSTWLGQAHPHSEVAMAACLPQNVFDASGPIPSGRP